MIHGLIKLEGIFVVQRRSRINAVFKAALVSVQIGLTDAAAVAKLSTPDPSVEAVEKQQSLR